MSSAAPTLHSDTWQRPAVASGPARRGGWLFWPTIAVIGWGLFVAEHETWHAIAATGDVETKLALDLSDVLARSNLDRRVGFLSIGLLGGLAFLVRPRRELVVDYRLLGWMLLLSGWVLASAMWADDMGMSLRRSMLPAFMLLAALGVGRHWRPERLCLMAVFLGLAFIAVGVITELRVGTFLRGDAYRFSGTLHPNSQAISCMAALLGSVCLYLGGARWKRMWLVVAAFALVMLLLTKSRTGAFSLLAGMMALFFWRASPRRRVHMMLAGGMLACLVLLVLLLVAGADPEDSALDVARMGREQDVGEVSSLTGRIPIWRELYWYIAERPLGGYGYGGFWTGDRVYELSAILDWEFSHAHSLYFEALLNVGIIGLSIGGMLALAGMRRAAAAARQTDNPGFLFLLTWLWIGAIHGVAEPSFIQPEFATMLSMVGLSLLVFCEPPNAEATT